MRLTKNDLARVIVQALYNLPELPAATHTHVINRERRNNVETLTRQHALAVAALNSNRGPF